MLKHRLAVRSLVALVVLGGLSPLVGGPSAAAGARGNGSPRHAAGGSSADAARVAVGESDPGGPPLPADGERVAGVIGFLGRLHPVAVHFPVALIVVAGVSELFFMRSRKPAFAFAARFVLYLASLLAVVSVLLGLAASSGKTFSAELRFAFEFHRIMGMVTAGMTLLTAGLAAGADSHGDAWRYDVYRVMLLLTVLAVALTAHYGATLVFGPGYLSIE